MKRKQKTDFTRSCNWIKRMESLRDFQNFKSLHSYYFRCVLTLVDTLDIHLNIMKCSQFLIVLKRS